MQIKVGSYNSNCERAGKELVHQVKEANAARKRAGSIETEAACRDMASYFCNKARERVIGARGAQFVPNRRIDAGKFIWNPTKQTFVKSL